MRPRALGAGAIGLALLVTGACAPRVGPRGVTPTEGDRFFVGGYHPYWVSGGWQDYPFDALDRLYFFEIEAGADGALADRHGWPEEWLSLLERARAEGVDVMPTLSLHGVEAFSELFASTASIAGLVEQAIGILVETPGLAGLHLDFEVFSPVPQEVRDGYLAFVARLRERMREVDPDFALSAFAMAFDDADVYAERTLAELTDYLVVQGYDYHSAEEPTSGPVAAVAGWGRLNWANVVDRFEALGVPPRKIVMAVPMYGYEWPTETAEPGSPTRGRATEILVAPPAGVMPELPRASERASLHGLRRDPESGTPYYAFEDATGWRQGWFEDAESLRAKYALVRARGLGGVVLFPLAYGDEALWRDLREAFRRPRE